MIKSSSDLHEAIAQTRTRIKQQHRSSDFGHSTLPTTLPTEKKKSKTQRSLQDHLRALPNSIDLKFYPLEKPKPRTQRQTILFAKKSEAVLLQNKLAFQKPHNAIEATKPKVRECMGESSNCCSCGRLYEYTIQKLCVSLQHVRSKLAYLVERVSSLTKQVEDLKLKNVLQVSPVEARELFRLRGQSGPQD